MATFGQGINPALGRIDYSPYMQGAAQGAQMQAQGMQSLGQGIAQGIEKYSELKQQNKEKEAMVKSGMKFIESLNDMQGISDDLKKTTLPILDVLHNPKVSLEEKLAAVKGSTQQFNMVLGVGQQAIENQQKQLQLAAQLQQANAAAKQAEADLIRANQVKPESFNFKENAVSAGVQAWLEANPGKKPTGADLQKIYSDVERMGAAQTNINMGGNAYDKTVNEALATRHMSEYTAALDAPQNIAKLDEVSNILKSGDVTTGVGAEVVQNVNRIRAQFLNDEKAGKTVSNTQILDSLLGSDVFPMIGALGIGARGMDTPAEREFLRAAFTGTKEMTPQAIQRLTEIRRDIQVRAVKKFKDNYEKGSYKKFFEATGATVPDFSILDGSKQTEKPVSSGMTWNPKTQSFE